MRTAPANHYELLLHRMHGQNHIAAPVPVRNEAPKNLHNEVADYGAVEYLTDVFHNGKLLQKGPP